MKPKTWGDGVLAVFMLYLAVRVYREGWESEVGFCVGFALCLLLTFLLLTGMVLALQSDALHGVVSRLFKR